VVSASISVRAGIDAALCGWCEFSPSTFGAAARQVDFDSLHASGSRITVWLGHGWSVRDVGPMQRALERHLRAFKRYVEERGVVRCETPQF